MIRIAIIILSLLIAACSGNQPQNNPENAAIHCHVEGTVHNRPDSDKLLLFVGISGYTSQATKPYAEIDIKNGKFSYDIYIDEAQYCELIFEEEIQSGYWQAIDFVADNNDIKMELYPREESGKNIIESAGSTAEYQSYKIALRELQDKTNKLRDELKSNGICYTEEYNSLMAKIEAASNNSLEQAKLLEQLQSMTEEQQYAPEFLAERKRYQAERKATLLKIVSREPSIARFSILARLMVYNLPDGEFIDIFKNIYAKAMPDNTTTAFCHRQINGHNLQIGARYIDFEAPDLDGNMHRFSEMIDGAKIVMLDLWASWCAPCRKASMEMIPLYEQYKDKGYAIVGVARETGSTKAMKNAIKKDGYKWTQLVELDDSGNIWAKYGCINSGGRRILMDSDGRILAFDPTIEELTTIIEKNLGK